MLERLFDKPLHGTKSFFLFGPRGTGKTTLIKSIVEDNIYIDLLEYETYKDLLANPGRLQHLIPDNYTGWIILDEIQKIPALLNEVHRLIESSNQKFILTGSSARSLRRKGVNLLAGRALTYHLYPMTAAELKEEFSLNSSLTYGHLPAIFSEPSPEEYLKSYLQTYIKEEVLQEGLTRNLSAFTHFLEVASFSQGSILNTTEIAREVGVDRKTIDGYFTILEDLLIADRITIFSRKSKRRLVRHPKFYFFDVGVYRNIRPKGPLDSPREIDGISLETLVYQELCAINHYYQYDYNIHYWRTSNGTEVDFILYGPRGLKAIEVKNSPRVSKRDLQGLFAFNHDYDVAKSYFLYRGTRKEYYDSLEVWPIDEFLKFLPEIL